MSQDSLEPFDELGLGIDYEITYNKWTTITADDKKPDHGTLLTGFKRLKGGHKEAQFAKLGGTEDRNHDLTDSKRNWHPTGPVGGVDVAELYPANFEEYFGYIDVWGWSAVLASSLVNGHPLRWTMYGLWDKYGFLKVYGIEKQTFFNFADRLERSYGKHKNTYHNSIHATDVLQTVHVMLNHTGLYHWLTDLELMAMLFGAAIHDAEHTGTTNAFHVAIQSGLAKLYNDKSVLENHHLQVAYTLLKRADCNILSKLDQEEQEYFRHLVVEMVLATDMAEHFSQLNEIKNTITKTEVKTLKLIASGEVPYPEQLEKPKIMALMIHAADISNALKPWSFSHYSTMQLLQEFFTQGDMSKMNRMAPAVLCDRKTTNIPNSQINFSRVLVLPTFELLNNTVKLLAEHFLPVSVKAKERDSENFTSGMTLELPGARPSRHKTGLNKFRKESLRPNAEINATTVLKECEKFEAIWRRHMEVNREKWTVEQQKEQMRERSRSRRSSLH